MVEEIKLTEAEPQAFPAVVGQPRVRRMLARALELDRLPHAYLFVGPDGTGRSAMAMELARALSCPRGALQSAMIDCDCPSCRNIRRWQHPNFLPVFPLPSADKDKGTAAQEAFEHCISLKAADPYNRLDLAGSGNILVEQIRELRNRLALASDRTGVRVVVIQPADNLIPASANALLKLLEEPPQDCCIILIAHSIRGLLPTIVSRCQLVPFAWLEPNDIAAALIKRGLEADKAEAAARLAGGSLQSALEIVASETHAMVEWGLEFLRAGAVGNALKTYELIETLTGSGRAAAAGSLAWIALWLNDALLVQTSAGNGGATPVSGLRSSNLEVVGRMAARYSTRQISDAISLVEEARLAIESNAPIGLVMTALAIRLNWTLK